VKYQDIDYFFPWLVFDDKDQPPYFAVLKGRNECLSDAGYPKRKG